MLRYHLLFITILFLSITSLAQTYRKLVKQADSLYTAKDFKRSNDFYQKAFKVKRKNENDLYNGACSAALAGDKRSAYEFLELAFRNGWTNITHLRKDTDLESLHNDKQWTGLLMRVQKKADELESSYDKALQKELLAIFDDDQNIRNQYLTLAKKVGFKNPKVDSISKIMRHTDSVDLIKVKRILDEKGWVGKDKVGEANTTLFLVIQHSDLKTQESYLPMMRDAVKKRHASANELALLEDRVSLRQGKKQVYGSQIYRNEKTNKYYVAPLDDPDNVDKRREKVGLGPMADYVAGWDIIWNLEEYKKQLPEIESLNKPK
jgi:hypothetical protein